jgi:hypothetical protein
MTPQEKVLKIYKVVADKKPSYWCNCRLYTAWWEKKVFGRMTWQLKWVTERWYTIIGMTEYDM